MMLFKSPHPDLTYPQNITTWQWLFEDPRWSPLLGGTSAKRLGSYVDAVTRECLNYAQVKEIATQLSTVLVHKYGLRPGETVSLFSTNTIWYPVAMWSVIRAGGRVNGASPAYQVEEMTYALKIAKAKILMTLPSALKVAVEAADQAGLPRKNIILLEGTAEGFVNIQQLIREAVNYKVPEPWRIPSNVSNKHVCGYLNFSSGTTGLPKAVMISHHNVIAQCMQLHQIQAHEPPGEEYRILAVMPLFHVTGLVRFVHYPMLMNGFSIMLPRFTLPSMLQAIVDYRIRELILVPPVIIRVVRDPITDKYDLRCVKRWSSGSAPISPEIIKELQRKFPWTGFRQGYGATESTAAATCHPPTHYDYKYATSGGIPVANTTIKIISIEDGRELGVGETGEVCAKGPQITIMGYLDNPEATRETFDKEGYLHTGDIGHMDADGMIHIEDRLKEMIKVKGLQVPPAELEDVLLGHPYVEDCAVLGVPDDYAGERPKAFVVLKAGTSVSEKVGEELLDYVRKRKVRYKWISEVEFTPEVPKSSTGKLLRRVLKDKERKGSNRGLRVRAKERARL